jgi:hypothetical protein
MLRAESFPYCIVFLSPFLIFFTRDNDLSPRQCFVTTLGNANRIIYLVMADGGPGGLNVLCIYRCKAKHSRYTPRRRLGERSYSSYSFLTSALDEVSGQRHAPTALCPHCTGGWVGPRAGLDTEARGKILCPCRG